MSGPQPRPALSGVRSYVQGRSEARGVPQPIKLSSNESAWGPSPRALAAYHDAAGSLSRYPDGSQPALRAAIAETFRLDPARLVCGNGSDEVISLLIRAFVGAGDEVLISEHSFVMSHIHATAQGAAVHIVPEPDYRIDVDGILARATARTRLVVIASPNNPCGTYLSRRELERLHAGLGSDTLLLCDAAYADFVTEDDYSCGFELAREDGTVMVTRTFSKLHGLAGLRIGWGYASREIISAIERIRTPFNTNVAAASAAAAAVRDREYTEFVRAENARCRAYLRDGCRRLGLDVIPSSANFLLLRFPGGAGQAVAACAHLESRGILVRPTGTDALADHLRITVGTLPQMDAVLVALAELMQAS